MSDNFDRGGSEIAKSTGGKAFRRGAAKGTINSGTRELIVEDIIRRLYSNELAPGQRLLEPQLVLEYGVSRGPVREALFALSAAGIVEIKAQRGAQIRVLGLEEAIDALLVVQQLVGFAAQTAAFQDHESPAGRRFRDCIEQLSAFPVDADPSQSAALREQFFVVLTDLAGNKELSRILSAVQVHLIRTQYSFLLREIDPFRAKDYQRIGKAILAREPRKSEAAARAHFERAIEKLRAFGRRD